MVSNVSTITEEVDETGASQVQFTVDCTYVKADDSAASESADGTGSEPDDTQKMRHHRHRRIVIHHQIRQYKSVGVLDVDKR